MTDDFSQDESQDSPERFVTTSQFLPFFPCLVDSGSEFLIKIMAWDGKMLGRAGAVIAKTDKGLLCLFCPANYSRTST